MPEMDHQAAMYETEAMNIQQQQQQQPNHQIEDEEDDEVAGGESIDNPQMRYEAYALQNGNVGGGGGGMEAMAVVDGVAPHALYVPGSEIAPAATGGGANQLTLSFQGEVYVFDVVSPEKDNAVTTTMRPVLMTSNSCCCNVMWTMWCSFVYREANMVTKCQAKSNVKKDSCVLVE